MAASKLLVAEGGWSAAGDIAVALSAPAQPSKEFFFSPRNEPSRCGRMGALSSESNEQRLENESCSTISRDEQRRCGRLGDASSESRLRTVENESWRASFVVGIGVEGGEGDFNVTLSMMHAFSVEFPTSL